MNILNSSSIRHVCKIAVVYDSVQVYVTIYGIFVYC
jgi:hypothetical protein